MRDQKSRLETLVKTISKHGKKPGNKNALTKLGKRATFRTRWFPYDGVDPQQQQQQQQSVFTRDDHGLRSQSVLIVSAEEINYRLL